LITLPFIQSAAEVIRSVGKKFADHVVADLEKLSVLAKKARTLAVQVLI